MQKSVCEIRGSFFINLSSKYHSCSFQFHIVLTSPIQLLPCFCLSVHQQALKNQWEVLLLVHKYCVRMMTEIIPYLAFLPYLYNEQWQWEKCSYYLMSKHQVKGWFFWAPHPDDNMRQILFRFETLILTLNIRLVGSLLSSSIIITQCLIVLQCGIWRMGAGWWAYVKSSWNSGLSTSLHGQSRTMIHSARSCSNFSWSQGFYKI